MDSTGLRTSTRLPVWMAGGKSLVFAKKVVSSSGQIEEEDGGSKLTVVYAVQLLLLPVTET